MADSAVVVTAGTGTNIDTRTEATNGNHRQVVVLGDPSTNAGVAPVDATAGLKVDLGADNDVTVTGNVAVTNAGITTIAGAVSGTEMQVDVLTLPAIPAGTNNIGDVDVLSVVPGTGATNLGKAIDTATGATDTGVLALATRDDALSALTPIEGDNVQLRTDSTGALWVKPSGTVTVDGSGVTQPVSGTFWQATQPVSLASVPSHAVTNAGTFAVQATEADGANTTLGAKADAKSTATDTTAVSVMSVLKQISASVQAPPSQAVTNAGTFATQVDGSALTALQLIDDPVFADDAAYTLSTSKGNVAAGVAVQTDGTDPTAVSAEGDAAALRTDMNRILLVNTTPPRLVSATENNATAQTNNPIHSAPGAGLSLYITDIVVSNGATAGSIKFVEDTAGTPVVKVQETYMAINGGAVMAFKTPIRITANKDFGYTSTTVTTHSITVNGYIAP